ncbi:transmembrane protein 132C-like [Arapaima gigas]
MNLSHLPEPPLVPQSFIGRREVLGFSYRTHSLMAIKSPDVPWSSTRKHQRKQERRPRSPSFCNRVHTSPWSRQMELSGDELGSPLVSPQGATIHWRTEGIQGKQSRGGKTTVGLKEGVTFLGARPSDPVFWMSSQEARSEGHREVTLHCQRKAPGAGQRSGPDNESAVAMTDVELPITHRLLISLSKPQAQEAPLRFVRGFVSRASERHADGGRLLRGDSAGHFSVGVRLRTKRKEDCEPPQMLTPIMARSNRPGTRELRESRHGG